jgi:Xaa-Pro aminopeptidase
VLEGEALAAFLGGGAARAGFSTIVGSGPNGTIPHYFENSRRIEPGELVVVDLGAEYQYYTADITRTFPADGRFTPRQREIYQLVLDAQRAVEAEMKPGQTKLGDMTRFTKEFFRNSPLRARDETGEERTMDHFFLHGLGHYLGMEVHDVGDYGEPVQVGEVFTIEPGLYIKSEALGVRIEDDYVMTEAGPEKLSKAIPSEPEEVERLIASKRQP